MGLPLFSFMFYVNRQNCNLCIPPTLPHNDHNNNNLLSLVLKSYQHLNATNVYVSTRQQVCASKAASRKKLRTASTPLFSLLDVLGDQGRQAVRYVALNASCVTKKLLSYFNLSCRCSYRIFKIQVCSCWKLKCKRRFFFCEVGTCISLLLLHSTSNSLLKILF